MPQDTTGGFSPIAEVDAIDDLRAFAPLVLDVSRREQVFADWDSPRRLAAENALQHIAYLHSITEWGEERLLEELGCRVQTIGDLQELDLEKLERCDEFVGLVSRTVGLVSTIPDRRGVVLECSALLAEASLDAGGLEEALNAGDFSALDYIRLGEISTAGRVAREHAGAIREKLTDADDPFAAVPTVHLSPPRIDIYLGGRDELLGEEVFNHIGLHLEDCEPCAAAVRSRIQGPRAS
jgi:hypothetical protein